MLTDCHLHLSLWPNPEENYLALRRAGLDAVAVSCSAEDSIKNARLGLKLGCRIMAGYHPWFARSAAFDRELFERLCTLPCLAGIGECGLDSDADLDLNSQQLLLKAQLDFAREHELPVNLHIRKCHGTLLKVLRRYGGRLRGCVHNFTFSRELASEYLKLGLKLCCGHHLLFRHRRLCESVRLAGPQRLLLETDAGGEHCGPYDCALLKAEFSALAEILGMPEESLLPELEHSTEIFIPRGGRTAGTAAATAAVADTAAGTAGAAFAGACCRSDQSGNS